MKSIITFCLFGLTVAAPAPQFDSGEFIKVIRSEISPVFGPNFNYLFETENGIFTEKRGSEGSNGQSNFVGSFSFITPEGQTVEVTYTADENGYNPQSDWLPVGPPIPEHALEQIRIAEELRAQGVEWDQQGFRINKKK